MSVTLAVLKLLRSSVVRLLQPLNIMYIVVISLVFRLEIPVMVVRLLMPLNQRQADLGRASANEALNTTEVT